MQTDTQVDFDMSDTEQNGDAALLMERHRAKPASAVPAATTQSSPSTTQRCCHLPRKVHVMGVSTVGLSFLVSLLLLLLSSYLSYLSHTSTSASASHRRLQLDLFGPADFTIAYLHEQLASASSTAGWPTSPRTVTFLPVPLSTVDRHLRTMSDAWFAEFTAVSLLVYVVGLQHSLSLPVAQLLHMSCLRNATWGQRVFVLQLDVYDDVGQPGVDKERLAIYTVHHLFAPHGLELLLRSDGETYINPQQLLEYGRSVHDVNAPLYTGRPQHDCLCAAGGPLRGTNCTASLGVNYCDGSSYFLNHAALRLYSHNIAMCRAPPSTSSIGDHCPSSSAHLGWCMESLGVKCTAAAINETWVALPSSGRCRGEPNAKGVKQTSLTQICEDSKRRLKEGRHGRPYAFEESDHQRCVTLHPIGSPAEMRYIRYAITRAANEVPALPAPAPACLVAIGILSAARHSLARAAIRATWGKLALLTDEVSLLFVLQRVPPSKPRLSAAVKNESSQYGDMLLLKPDESLASNVGWMEWALKNTKCSTFFTTNDDSYVRIMPLLDWVSNHYGSAVSTDMAYFGLLLTRPDASHSPVIYDSSNHLWTYDTHSSDSSPPYMDGAGYGVTRSLAKRLVTELRTGPQPVYEDEAAGLGDIINSIQAALQVNSSNSSLSADTQQRGLVEYDSPHQFYYPRCLPDSILDSPRFSQSFNMYKSYYRDLNSTFCQSLLLRRGTTGSVAVHVDETPVVYDDDMYSDIGGNSRAAWLELEKAYKQALAWQEAPRDPTARLTVIITSYQHNLRTSWLGKTIDTYLSSDFEKLVDRVLLVWNNVEEPCPIDLQHPSFFVLNQTVNSLNNRWIETLPYIRTDAVLNLDDDILVTVPAVECMFSWWRAEPDRLIGPFARRIQNDNVYVMSDLLDGEPYTIVLPRAIILSRQQLVTYAASSNETLRYVDEQKARCDDVWLNARTVQTTKKPPLRVRLPAGSVLDLYEQCKHQFRKEVGGLAMQTNRTQLRTECVAWMAGQFADDGHNPLHTSYTAVAECSAEGHATTISAQPTAVNFREQMLIQACEEPPAL